MSPNPHPLSLSAVAVLTAIRDGHRYGFDIMDAAALPSGTVYPILSRLTKSGLLSAKWEPSVVARREKRPARKYYVVTDAGTEALLHALHHYQTLGGRLGAPARLRPAQARGR